MADVNEYEVAYGHSERIVKEPAKDYESAMKRLAQLTTERLPCRGPELGGVSSRIYTGDKRADRHVADLEV